MGGIFLGVDLPECITPLLSLKSGTGSDDEEACLGISALWIGTFLTGT